MNKISVVIPTYNREKTIEYCLKSVLQQTLQPFEIIIIDDCSNDKTLDIVKKINSSLIKVFKLDKNSGAQAARNRGINEATGDWIAFIDSDDEWLNFKLQKQIEKAENENYKVIYCECLVKKNNQIQKFITPNYEGDTHNKLLINPGPTFPGLLVKKECFDKLGILDEKVPAYQEWDTSIYLSEIYEFGFIEEPLFIYHLHEGETISKNPYRDAEGYSYIVDKYYYEIRNEVGLEALINHYNIIIDKYDKINDADKCLKYEKKLIDLKYEGRKNFNKSYNNSSNQSNNELLQRYKSYYLMYNKWISNLHNKKYLHEYLIKNNYKRISIYGMGEVAVRLYEELISFKVNVECIIVKTTDGNEIMDNIPILEIKNLTNIESDLIIVTPIYDFSSIRKELLHNMVKGKIISLKDLIYMT